MNQPAQHHFVSISVMPVEARTIGDDVEYTEAPEKQQDHSPEVVCQLCFRPGTAEVVNSPCPGAKVPNDLSSLTG